MPISVKRVEPLRNEVAIVGQNGHPNPYFMRLWQDTLANVQKLEGAKQPADPDLDQLAALDGTGIAVRFGPDQWTTRSLAAPAAGFTITNPAGVAGDPTFVLANDLAALEALSGTHTIYYRSAANTWTAVTIGPGLDFTGAVLAAIPAIQSVVSNAAVTPTFANTQVNITAQAAALTLANPTGTAVDGWQIIVRIKDDGNAWGITYGGQYRAIGVTLPVITVVSKTLYLFMRFNAADTKWDVTQVAQEV